MISKKGLASLMISIIAVLIPKMIIIESAIPFTDIRDEVAMLYTPATIAKFDWSSILSTSSYYGFGFFAIFAPLFKIGLSITDIYRIILIVTVVLESLVPIIVFYMMDSYWQIKKNQVKIFVAIGVSMYTVNPPYNLINEHILILVYWFILLICCELIRNKASAKRRIVLSACLIICLAYSLTLHERALMICIGILTCFIVYRMIFGEWIVRINGIAGILVVCVIIKEIVKVVQKTVWGSNNLVNASITLPKISEGISIQNIYSIITYVLGNVGTLTIYTSIFGIIVWVIAICFCTYKVALKKESDLWWKTFFVVLFIGTICAGGTLFALALRSMGVIYMETMPENKVYGYKSLTYLRYYLCYIPPVIMLLFVFFEKQHLMIKKWFLVGCVGSVELLFLWIKYVVPYIENTYFGISSFYPFALVTNKKQGERLLTEDFYAIFLVCVFVGVIEYICVMKKKNVVILVMLVGIWYAQFMYFPQNYSQYVSENNYHRIDATQVYLNNIQGIEEYNIYVNDKEDLNTYLVQAYNYQLSIKRGIPEEDEKALVISNEVLPELLELGYMETLLDKKEWIYIKREE